MSEPRRHHYVPEFILKAWTNDKGQLIQFASKNGKLDYYPTSPSNVCVEKDLYKSSARDPLKAQIIEKNIMGPLIDSPASEVHRHFLSSSTEYLSEKQKISWVKFLMAQRIRTPDSMAKLRALDQRALDDLEQSEDEYQKLRKETDPATFKEYAEKNFPEYIENFGLRVMMRLMLNNDVADRMLRMVWGVRTIDRPDCEFLLSDRPLVIEGDIRVQDTALIYMPISPTMLFVAINHPKHEPLIATAPLKDFIFKANRKVLSQTARFAFGKTLKNRALMEKYFKKNANPA